MKVIIDRFEEDIAVVELDGEMLHAPRALFAEAREGDTVELTVLPRRSSDPSADADAAQKAEQFREATRRFFHKDAPRKDEEDDDPAALFAKLRKKKKREG